MHLKKERRKKGGKWLFIRLLCAGVAALKILFFFLSNVFSPLFLSHGFQVFNQFFLTLHLSLCMKLSVAPPPPVNAIIEFESEKAFISRSFSICVPTLVPIENSDKHLFSLNS